MPVHPPRAADVVMTFVAGCTEHERVVLTERIFTDTRVPLDRIARRLGLSKARTTGLDAAVRGRVRSELASSTAVEHLGDMVLDFADPVAALDRVVRTMPELGIDIPILEIPMWAVLSRLDDRMDIVDGWVHRGSVAEARRRLDAAVATNSSEENVASIHTVADALSLPAGELVRFATTAGFRCAEGHLVRSAMSVPDQIAAALALAGEPLTADALRDRVHPRRSGSGVRNALVGDPRFLRSDRTRWALSRWKMTPYVPIHRQIAAIVDEHGSIGIDRLVSDITSAYDVTETSVRTYAATGDFETRSDVVSRRTHRYTPRKSPSATRHLYRDGDVVRWRTTVAPIHLRGSAFNLPSALAALLDVGPGATREFASRLGPQSVIWVSVQARSGTIKRFVDSMDLHVGEDIFLEFGDGTFDVRRAETGVSHPLRAVVAAIGIDPDSAPSTIDAVVAQVAESMWLDGAATLAAVQAVVTARRDEALHAALDRAVDHRSGHLRTSQ